MGGESTATPGFDKTRVREFTWTFS